MSPDTTIHHSFDIAQQVSFRYYLIMCIIFTQGVIHYSMVQCIYFLTPRNCAIFAVSCEGIQTPRQVNVLLYIVYNTVEPLRKDL